MFCGYDSGESRGAQAPRGDVFCKKIGAPSPAHQILRKKIGVPKFGTPKRCASGEVQQLFERGKAHTGAEDIHGL